MAASEPLRYVLDDTWELVAIDACRTRDGTLTADLVLQNGHPVHVARAALNEPAARAAFAAAALANVDSSVGVLPDATALAEGLITLAANAGMAVAMGPPPKATAAGDLAALAKDVELWHTPEGKAYASIPVAGHTEHWPVEGKDFRDWLARRSYQEVGRVPGGQALQDAIVALAGQARYDGAEHTVHVRVAEHEGALYLDLGNAAWEAVRISPDLPHGWQVVSTSPVRFRRPRGQAPLPTPVPGGSVQLLRPFINCGEDASIFILAVAWLLATFRPDGPYPALALHGEQGSAKSTTARVLGSLVDPNVTPLRTAPRDERDLAVAANNRHVVSFDNLSKLPDWLSDALCRLATGGGFGTRELYSDDEEAIFNLQRPVLLNGIEELATRPDLAERTILLTLPTIADTARQDEKGFWHAFETARPAILGALLTVVVTALRNLPSTRLTRKPRMADFALWVTAAEAALDWAPGTFLAAYEGNRALGHEAALETSVIGMAVKSLADDLPAGETWAGTMAELLAKVEGLVDERHTKRRDWPQTPRALAGIVRRCTPALRALGVTIDHRKERTKAARRLVIIGKEHGVDDRPNRPNRQLSPDNAAVRRTVGEHARAGAATCATSDSSDDSDGVVQPAAVPAFPCPRCGAEKWHASTILPGQWICEECYVAAPSEPSDACRKE